PEGLSDPPLLRVAEVDNGGPMCHRWSGEAGRVAYRERSTGMPTYVTLYKLTEQGAREMKTLPDRVRATQARAAQQGIKVLGRYLTQGQYDVVTIVDAPDEMAVAAGTLAIAGAGNF